MVLHLGEGQSVPAESVIAILTASSPSPEFTSYIASLRRLHRYSACKGKPKAYVLVRERGRDRIYASIISPATLQKRLVDTVLRLDLFEAAVLTTGES